MAVHGLFYYRKNLAVWLNNEPECESWGNYKVPEIECRSTFTYSTTHIDVLGWYKFAPGAYQGNWSPGQYGCAELDGVLPKNPIDQDGGEWLYHEREHFRVTPVMPGDTCPWGHFPAGSKRF
jgi:hypothetical protein